MSSLLEVRDLYLEFKTARGRLQALNGINFSVKKGEFFGLVGETGCGKTVTGLAMMKLLSRSARIPRGEIFLDGTNLLALSRKEIQAVRGGKIAMIFQDPSSSLNPVFTVGGQILRVIRQHMKMPAAQAKAYALEMLQAVGLPDVGRIFASYPHQLSGGQQQRVMIAMAMSTNPRILIADEPTTALDVTVQKEIIQLIRDLQKEFQTSVVFISHDLALVRTIADFVMVMNKGVAVEYGAAEAVFASPQHAYTKALIACRPRLNNNPE